MIEERQSCLLQHKTSSLMQERRRRRRYQSIGQEKEAWTGLIKLTQNPGCASWCKSHPLNSIPREFVCVQLTTLQCWKFASSTHSNSQYEAVVSLRTKRQSSLTRGLMWWVNSLYQGSRLPLPVDVCSCISCVSPYVLLITSSHHLSKSHVLTNFLTREVERKEKKKIWQ